MEQAVAQNGVYPTQSADDLQALIKSDRYGKEIRYAAINVG